MAEIVDADAFTLGLERFVRLGGKVSQRFARAKLGFEEPEEGDELLGPPTASMPGKVGSDETASKADGDVAEEEGAEEEGDEAAHSVGQDGGDAIDGLLGDLFGGGGWRELVAPVIDPVTAAIEGSATPEELRARLAALIADMDTTRLQEALARTGFNAQVAGSVGAPLTGDPAF
jgi:phage gp29-like protein